RRRCERDPPKVRVVDLNVDRSLRVKTGIPVLHYAILNQIEGRRITPHSSTEVVARPMHRHVPEGEVDDLKPPSVDDHLSSLPGRVSPSVDVTTPMGDATGSTITNEAYVPTAPSGAAATRDNTQLRS